MGSCAAGEDHDAALRRGRLPLEGLQSVHERIEGAALPAAFQLASAEKGAGVNANGGAAGLKLLVQLALGGAVHPGRSERRKVALPPDLPRFRLLAPLAVLGAELVSELAADVKPGLPAVHGGAQVAVTTGFPAGLRLAEVEFTAQVVQGHVVRRGGLHLADQLVRPGVGHHGGGRRWLLRVVPGKVSTPARSA
ncbi:hypothetical protein CTI14_02355 [Methylobacterium radiotolerans]|nr:hypothetical protein CTI14_02355 [Methylobacterium radiotolerans]